MQIPEQALEKLICSECLKYLSVGPIKVYPNRQVKCGRCSQEDDIGTESILYRTLVKDLVFPCVNRFEGCCELYPISEMKSHEEECEDNQYECPLCPTFCRKTAYDLRLHCKKDHQKQTLDKDFLILLDECSQRRCYFYCQDQLLFFVTCKYELDGQNIFLDISFVGKHYKGDINQSFMLYSIYNHLMYKSSSVPCSRLDCQTGESFEINVSRLKFDKNVVVCRFMINKEPVLHLRDNIIVIDPSVENAVFKCYFKNVSKLNTNGQMYFLPVLYAMEIPWKVFIQKSIKNGELWLAIALKRVESEEETEKELDVMATFTLVSRKSKNVSESFPEVRRYKNGSPEWGMWLVKWGDLIKLENGYIVDDQVNVEVKFKAYLPEQNGDRSKCGACNKQCPFCKK